MLDDLTVAAPRVGRLFAVLWAREHARRRLDDRHGLLSTVIAVPIAVSARWLTFANLGRQVAVGIVTIAIGAHTIVATTLARTRVVTR